MSDKHRASDTPHDAFRAILYAVRGSRIDSRSADVALFIRLHELGAQAAATGQVGDLFDYVLEITLGITRAEAGTVHLADPDSGRLVLASDRFSGETMARLRDANDDGQELLRLAFQRGERIGIADLKRSMLGGVTGRQALLDLHVRAAQWVPFVATSGAVLGVVGVYFRSPRDLSVRQEALIVRFARHAADFVEYARARRELQLRLARERDAHQRADESIRRRDQFLATLSHELRQPLSAALSALDLGKRRLSPDRQARVDQLMERQLRQLVRLVDDLIDLSHVERGTLALQRARLDLRRLLQDAVEMTAPLFDARRQERVIDLGHAPCWISADAARLTQVFSNLLQNAASYTPVGGAVRLTVEFDEREATVRVHDTGVGMDPATLARIFDPFERGDAAAGRASFGIGLSVVRQIVQMHGGSVRAISDGLGRGSEFVITLPIDTRDRS